MLFIRTKWDSFYTSALCWSITRRRWFTVVVHTKIKHLKSGRGEKRDGLMCEKKDSWGIRKQEGGRKIKKTKQNKTKHDSRQSPLCLWRRIKILNRPRNTHLHKGGKNRSVCVCVCVCICAFCIVFCACVCVLLMCVHPLPYFIRLCSHVHTLCVHIFAV